MGMDLTMNRTELNVDMRCPSSAEDRFNNEMKEHARVAYLKNQNKYYLAANPTWIKLNVTEKLGIAYDCYVGYLSVD